MIRNYPEYYLAAKEKYKQEFGLVTSNKNIDDINVSIIDPNTPSDIISLPTNYMTLVDNIAEKVNEYFKDESHCYFPTDVDRKTDVVLRLKDKYSFEISEAQELCSILMPQLEAKYFHCHLNVEKAFFYRNVVTDNPPIYSWLWHYDNHPKEVHKIIIYLSDVNEDSGPFEYLHRNGRAKVINPSRTGLDHWTKPKWPRSRVPLEVIDNYIKTGYETKKVTGKKGTMILFDDNCVHKANIGKSGYRDVIAFQFRPAISKMTPYLHPDWTGGFQTNHVQPHPENHDPYFKDKEKNK